MLNHLPDPHRAVAAWTRCLRPGGRLSLSLWDPPEINRFFGLISEAIGELEEDAVPQGPDPYRYTDPQALAELLHGAGLGEVRTNKLSFVQGVPGVDERWKGLLGGSVRSAARVGAAPEEERRRVPEPLEALAEECREGDELRVPVSVVVASAVRPAP